MSDAGTTPICPCGTIVFPQVIYNPPGLRAIAYRLGDYIGFRHALLQALPGETELTIQEGDRQVVQTWRPGAEGDLAVQMVEWWAYLSDVLTFYNERLANEAYLRTAVLPESVNRLIQLLGYRPRPALGASGTLAALLNRAKPVTLAKGFHLQSKPGPGQQPQTFELDADTIVQMPDVIATQPVTATLPLLPSGGAIGPAGQAGFIWLAAKVSGIRQGDKLLLVNAQALQGESTTDFAWLAVTGVAQQSDPTGNPVTQVSYSVLAGTTATGEPATNYVLLRGSQAMPPWSFTSAPGWTTPVFTPGALGIPASPTTVDLAGLARGVGPGDLMLFEVTGTMANGIATTPIILRSYSEIVWYANGNGPNPPIESPPDTIPAISIPHSHMTFAALPSGNWNTYASHITVRWGWTNVGQLVPVLSAQDIAYSGGSTALAPATGTVFPAGRNAVLLEDTNGNGASAEATTGTSGTVTLTNLSPLPQNGLASPIDMFFNLLSVSRGKTVTNEVLGSGNPAVPDQDFALKQAPVTYLQDPVSKSGDNYSSTVQVWVNGLQWSEVRSFYGQGNNAQIFVLREDDQGQTHVVFGDGINGARLPTGVNNVVANYRYGAGADAPEPETLTVVLNPQPGLKAIRNPLPPTGGADADPPSRIRTLAPRSVMTFDRAVSLDDYQAIAAGAPGVVQATVDFVYDRVAQRPRVTLWVAGDAGAVTAVRAALAGAADPNRPVNIIAASPIEARISVTYVRDPRRDDATIQAGLTAALLDPDAGLFGTNVVGIGQAFYDSQIYSICASVPGVDAVHNLEFSIVGASMTQVGIAKLVSHAIRLSPQPACTEHRHDPGAGNYFSIPNDGRHLTLTGAVAS
jgi:hypothetical protein